MYPCVLYVTYMLCGNQSLHYRFIQIVVMGLVLWDSPNQSGMNIHLRWRSTICPFHSNSILIVKPNYTLMWCGLHLEVLLAVVVLSLVKTQVMLSTKLHAQKPIEYTLFHSDQCKLNKDCFSILQGWILLLWPKLLWTKCSHLSDPICI